MSYTVYTTPAIVLASWDRGEDNIAFDLFTEELGRVIAEARGITKLSSKLRFALQLYSFANVSLIHGKSGWRLINAEPRSNVYYDFMGKKKDIFIESIELIRRLMPFEERYTEIFANIQHLSKFVTVGDSEKLVVFANLLWRLGYLPARDIYTQSLTDKKVNLTAAESRGIKNAIATALHNTQL
jgi:recombinational DNA repair protein (RecF pathway)